LDARCGVRCEASLASPNQRALVSSAKFAPLSGVKGVSPSADSIAYAASAPKDTNKVPNCKAETKALCSVIIFAATQRSKHHCMLKAKLPRLRSQRFLPLSSHLEAELNV